MWDWVWEAKRQLVFELNLKQVGTAVGKPDLADYE
jgi:hypothetical protein